MKRQASQRVRRTGWEIFVGCVWIDHLKDRDDLTLRELADYLNRRRVPRYRGGGAWTAQAVHDVRIAAADLRARPLV
jgi:hypothetical protein